MFGDLNKRISVRDFAKNQKKLSIKCDNILQAEEAYNRLIASGLKCCGYSVLPGAEVYVTYENTNDQSDYVLRHVAVLQASNRKMNY